MKEFIIADAHTDFLSRAMDRPHFFDAAIGEAKHITKDGLMQGRVGLQIFAAFTDAAKADPTLNTLRQIDTFYEMAQRWENIELLTPSNLQLASSGSKTYAMLSIEGAEAFKDSMQAFSAFVRMGVRAVTLVWNHENEVASPAYTGSEDGLKPFGRKLVNYMNSNGIAIDVSHLNVKGFWDVIAASSKPIMASHSNAYNICPHSRNLYDDQIKEIIRTGGYIGLNFYSAFLTEEKQAHLSDIVKHAQYILELGGENVLGMGSDFDGIDSMPVEIAGAEDFQMVMQALADAGIDDATLEKISHRNLMRFLSEVFD